jgi:hypothetical protein
MFNCQPLQSINWTHFYKQTFSTIASQIVQIKVHVSTNQVALFVCVMVTMEALDAKRTFDRVPHPLVLTTAHALKTFQNRHLHVTVICTCSMVVIVRIELTCVPITPVLIMAFAQLLTINPLVLASQCTVELIVRSNQQRSKQ